jgi:hypothetical protein
MDRVVRILIGVLIVVVRNLAEQAHNLDPATAHPELSIEQYIAGDQMVPQYQILIVPEQSHPPRHHVQAIVQEAVGGIVILSPVPAHRV